MPDVPAGIPDVRGDPVASPESRRQESDGTSRDVGPGVTTTTGVPQTGGCVPGVLRVVVRG
jgi:hypothetical protein